VITRPGRQDSKRRHCSVYSVLHGSQIFGETFCLNLPRRRSENLHLHVQTHHYTRLHTVVTQENHDMNLHTRKKVSELVGTFLITTISTPALGSKQAGKQSVECKKTVSDPSLWTTNFKKQNRSEVKWSVVQGKGVDRGVPWRVFMVGEVMWSEGPVKIGVLYLWSNNIRN
jgi:hypothetical protein